jgi:hypothetical protein
MPQLRRRPGAAHLAHACLHAHTDGSARRTDINLRFARTGGEGHTSCSAVTTR